MSTLTCRDLTKRFGEVVAVNQLNLTVKDREFVVLVGPSGCGKTTALRLIAGLESITEGEVLLDDQVVNRIAPGRRDMAMVFQNYALYPHMRVFDNIAYSLRLRHTAPKEIESRVTAVARLLDVEPLLQRWPKQLSGGQRQRVALGRAIVREPRAFLMDEPLSNLDAQLRVQMRREIIHLQRQLGITTIYVTHDQVEAMTMGDRIVVMRDGVVHQVGEPDEVYRRPRNVFVARFIGSPAMNLIGGTLASDGGQLYLQADSFRLKLPDTVGLDLERARLGGTRDVIWGIRPEDVDVVDGAVEGEGASGVIDLVEHLGADSYASVKVGGELILVRVSPDLPLREDQPVSLSFAVWKSHFFDAASGDSLTTSPSTTRPPDPRSGGDPLARFVARGEAG